MLTRIINYFKSFFKGPVVSSETLEFMQKQAKEIECLMDVVEKSKDFLKCFSFLEALLHNNYRIKFLADGNNYKCYITQDIHDRDYLTFKSSNLFGLVYQLNAHYNKPQEDFTSEDYCAKQLMSDMIELDVNGNPKTAADQAMMNKVPDWIKEDVKKVADEVNNKASR